MNYEDIPKREPVAGDFWGPGIGDDLTDIKAVDLLDEEFAVMGFIVLPSSYQDEPVPFAEPGEIQKKEYAKVEIMWPDGKHYVFNTSSKSLMTHLKKRMEADEIPFKTTLVQVKSQSSKYKYYKFN